MEILGVKKWDGGRWVVDFKLLKHGITQHSTAQYISGACACCCSCRAFHCVSRLHTCILVTVLHYQSVKSITFSDNVLLT